MKRLTPDLRITTFFVLLFLAMSCSEETQEPVFDDASLLYKWSLAKVVNISDEHKYLQSTLQFAKDHYTLTSNTGAVLATGTWHTDQNSLQLQFALFDNGGTPTYRVLKLDPSTLVLEEHYTLDNKDALLEYHFEKVN